MPNNIDGRSLAHAAAPSSERLLNPDVLERLGGIQSDCPVLVVLAAGKGTRFGALPKCSQPVGSVPLARHAINAFRSDHAGPVIGVVGHRYEDVSAALGGDIVHVRSDNPTGGTAYAVFEAFSVPGLIEANPLVVVTMGDRIVTPSVFRALLDVHRSGSREADLSLLSAVYEPPRNRGKGRLMRDGRGQVTGIMEERDIMALEDSAERKALLETTEGNCPLYAARAATLHRYLSALTNDNAQGQYYVTDVVEAISRDGGVIRSITTTPDDLEYDLLCCDITRPEDLEKLSNILSKYEPPAGERSGLNDIAASIAAHRPPGQVASIACQLEALWEMASAERLNFRGDQPVGLGIAGGRLRIAFMHPDMGRFFGPAWQMPIGAADASSREQIVILAQSSDDGCITVVPDDPRFREDHNSVPADSPWMMPGDDIVDSYTYEDFGTRMAARLLRSLGYLSDEALATRQREGKPLPPADRWISNSMRRPFSLICNALASLRTVRKGLVAPRIHAGLARENFKGLRVMSTGDIPQGGFASSTAVTIAAMNAVNGFYDFGISPDLLVGLACRAEYGTGVRAGSLDQATEQKGKAGEGTLISSNPRDNYRVIGTYPVPTHRYKVLFPYCVDRDREAWRWSAGGYAENTASSRLTALEMRKMTGKAAELAAILTRLPLDVDFFQKIEDDLIRDGMLNVDRRRWICGVLKSLPLRATQSELKQRLAEHREWLVEQLVHVQNVAPDAAADRADVTLDALFAGWRDPMLYRTDHAGRVVAESGAPLRAMVAYLFGEVAKNFYLIHHPDDWIAMVSLSQRGDCSFDIDPDRLPSKEEMLDEMDWEKDASGPALLARWLKRVGATPFDYNRDLDDEALSREDPVPFHALRGGNFFRGLALIDLAEAMLKRAFGKKSVAIRVNAAGQGDYFQVHVDTRKASVETVKEFIRKAFYRRFGLSPDPAFAELHTGGGAVGARLDRFDALPALIQKLRSL